CEAVVFVIFDHVVPLVDDCHLTMLPACPLNVIVPLFVPVQTVVLPLILPPATGVTVIVALVEFADAHAFCCTTTLNNVVWVRLAYNCDVVVLAIGVHVVPPLMDCSQRITLPV